MTRQIFRYLLLTGILAISFLSGAHAQPQRELNAIANAGLEKADKQLNSVYQKVLREHQGNPAFCRDLREAQRSWLRFVELHLKCSFPLREGEDPRMVYGSVYPMDYALLHTELVKQRIAQLEQIPAPE